MKRAMMIIAAVVVMALSVGVLMPQAAYADAKSDVCSGIGGCDNNTGPSVDNVVTTVVNIISIIAGIAGVIMVVVAGLRFITSGGDAGKAASARSALVYALIGLAIAASAQIIVRFVINRAVSP